VFTSKDGATNTGWRVTATPLTRRSSTRHGCPKPLQQTLRHRVELPISQAEPRVHQFSGCWTAAGDVCSEPIASEQLAVSSLEVRGGARRGGAASGDGRSRSSVRWCCGQPGQRLVCAGLFQRTNHSTTGSSGSCPPLRTAIVSGDTVASAAVRRRQRPLTAETHRPCHFEN